MNVLISRPGRYVAFVAAVLLTTPPPAVAQTGSGDEDDPCARVVASRSENAGVQADGALCLTLDDAEGLALDGNRTLAASRARARAADARAEGASAFLYPTVGAEAGAIRSDDPVAAFGMRLQQGRFTQADFSPDLLNHPDPVADWTAGLGVSWTALDPGQWAGREAARQGARAASFQAERTREAVLYQTRVLYLQAVRAQAQLEAARSAEAAAGATASLLERRRDEGMLTDADVLQGVAARADARARTVDAERQVDDARARLGLHLGVDPSRSVIPVEGVEELIGPHGTDPSPGAPGKPSPSPAVDERADLQASAAGLEAVRAQVDRARMSRLPTVELFGKWATHAPGAFDGRESDVTLGLQLRLPLFTGFRIGAAVDEARAEERAMAAEHEARRDEAAAQVEETRRAVRASVRGVEAAGAAADAAEEAHRLVRRRFEEGLATTAELLQAEARAAALRASAVDARARAAVARATLDFVLGATTSGDTRTTTH